MENSPNTQNQPLWVPVAHTAECKRCGRKDLAWQQSRNGKWYLVVTRRTQDGKLVADRRGFHHCQETFKNAHGGEITDNDIPF